MTHLDRDVVTAILDRVVAEKGEDYVYPPHITAIGTGPSCTYTNEDGTPSCIVGHVLAEVLPELMPHLHQAEWEFKTGAAIAQLSGEGIVDDDGYPDNITLYVEPIWIDDDRLLNALSYAQAEQDNGATWGSALREYKRVLNG